MSTNNSIKIIVFPLILITTLLYNGCDDEVTSIEAIDAAIYALENQSDDWRSVLEDTRDKLTNDTQSTIRNEVSNMLARAIAATGSEFRCDLDFVRDRIKQDLLRIKASLLNQPVPDKEPVLCTVNPLAVDATLIPDRLPWIEFYGYDFDTTPIKVLLQNGTQLIDVSSHLSIPSHYHMTLNLATNGVSLSPNSNQFILVWKNSRIHTIGISQQPQIVNYKIEIRTWNKKSASAASDGKVYLTLIGALRSISEFRVEGDYRRGDIETKFITNQKDIGDLTSVIIRYKDGREHNAWKLDWIRVTNQLSGRRWTADCDMWLGNQNPLQKECEF